MEPLPNNKLPPDRARDTSLTEPSSSTMSAAAISLPTSNNQLVLYAADRPASSYSSISSVTSNASIPSHTASAGSSLSAPIEKLSRPMAFDKVKPFPFVSYTLHAKISSGSFYFHLMKPSIQYNALPHHNENHNYYTWVDFA